MTIERWLELASRVQFLETRRSDGVADAEPVAYKNKVDCGTVTEAEIIAFEQERNVLLPTEYKEFCQIFGTGIAGDRFRIWCPSKELAVMQDSSPVTINYIREFPSNNPQADQEKVDLLSHAFHFADDMGSYNILWDLRTYQDADESYDIYWYDWEAPESDNFSDDFVFIGRSFFEFVRDYCFGSKASELKPSNYSDDEPAFYGDPKCTFLRFKR